MWPSVHSDCDGGQGAPSEGQAAERARALPASRPERLGAPRTTARATTTRARAARPRKASATTRSVKRRGRSARRAEAAPRANAQPRHGPRAVRAAAHRRCETAPRAEAPPPKPLGAPKGTELVTTAIRATGELAQIGFTVGGQVLKRTIDRIPRP